MAKFIIKPNELEFLKRVAQMTDEKEIKKAEKEYDEQVDAYFDWMKKKGTGSDGDR